MTMLKAINLSNIKPGKNPRTNFPQEEHDELVESIRSIGLIQNIVVIALDDNTYEIVAGERRWRALNELAEKDNRIQIKYCFRFVWTA